MNKKIVYLVFESKSKENVKIPIYVDFDIYNILEYQLNNDVIENSYVTCISAIINAELDLLGNDYEFGYIKYPDSSKLN